MAVLTSHTLNGFDGTHAGFIPNQDLIRARLHIMDEIIFRFSMPDREGHYHIPIIINPNSYSVWWSGD